METKNRIMIFGPKSDGREILQCSSQGNLFCGKRRCCL
jgi:hypothetical protein